MFRKILGGSLAKDEYDTLYSISMGMPCTPQHGQMLDALYALSLIQREREKVRITPLGIFRLTLGHKPNDKALAAAIKCYELGDFPKTEKPARRSMELVWDAVQNGCAERHRLDTALVAGKIA